MDRWLDDFNDWYNKKGTRRRRFPQILLFPKWLYEKFMNQKFMLISWRWWLGLKLHNMLSRRRIRVGFGPVQSGENTLRNRKWPIDPMVNYINKNSDKYVCDIFFDGDDLTRFDIIVQVKNFDSIDQKIVEQLKKNNAVLIYDIADNPLGCQKSYLEETWYIKSMDAVIINSPLQGEDIRSYNSNFRLVGMPIINNKYKKDYTQKEPIIILWQGYMENMRFTDNVNSIIKKIAEQSRYKIKMIYHSNISSKDEGIIKYVKWKLRDWEKMLINADIAIAIKPGDNRIQQRKPPTKTNTYRAAGLPLVCTPSESDKQVIENGKTGYIAYADDDWYIHLKKLIENPKLREEIGRAGRKYVLENFSIKKIGQEYIELFDELVSKRK